MLRSNSFSRPVFMVTTKIARSPAGCTGVGVPIGVGVTVGVGVGVAVGVGIVIDSIVPILLFAVVLELPPMTNI
ncbi:hypothetical protein D3C73_1353030 [compost metagenome]